MEWNLIDKQHEFLRLLERQGKSFNTVKNYKADLQCFNTFLIDKQQHLKIRSFTGTQVQEYSQYLDQKYGSPNSVRRRVQALRLFFDYLLSQEIFPENPLKKMPVSPKVLDNPEPTPFPEVLKTYQILKRREKESDGLSRLVNCRNVIIFHLIYGSGLKVSDLAKLSFESILKDKHGFRVLVEHPKRDPYSIPLPAVFNEDFKIYQNLRLEYLNQENKEMDELLFNANPYKVLSGGISPRGTELFFEELRRELKNDMTAKSLRQSCIFKWLNMNINHSTIKEWLGVTPSYSMELYLEELSKYPIAMVFQEIEEEE
ncbi:MAG: phage integrase N-terminal SAM-like domain-containing protein [Bacteriovoracaceae bacterium]|nr:phage integrase N-terminal SAM-like domain-containing protein [Bacteriovoracaceae bacterium]